MSTETRQRPPAETTPTRTEEPVLLPAHSKQQPAISVVLPTLDEEDGIVECIARIKRALADLGMAGEVIVSDSSTDRTPELARQAGAIVVEPDRPGYGYAYRYAFEYARGDYVVMGDADTTYDFESIPRLLDPVLDGEADLVLGSRFEGEIKPGAMPPLHKYLGNPALTKFLNVFYDAGVSDAHSGFRVFRRELLDDLDLHSDGMEFASEMVMAAATSDVRIAEVPIVYHEREGEETLNSFHDGWRHVKFMLVNAPGYLFSGPAVACLALGLLTMALSLSGITLGRVTFGTHTMIAGSLLTIVGYQAGSLAVFSSIATDPIRRPADPITAWVRNNVHLEHGAAAGVVLCLLGSGYLTAVAWHWLASGTVGFAFIVWNMLAFTVIVLGLQTVFYSFFMSMLARRREA